MFFRCTAVASKSVSDALHPKNRPFCPKKLRHIPETVFAMFFYKIQADMVKKRQKKHCWLRLGKTLTVGL